MQHYCKFVPISRKNIRTTYCTKFIIQPEMVPRYVKKIHEYSQRENPRESISRNLPVTQAQKFFQTTTVHFDVQNTELKRIYVQSVSARFIKQSLGAFCDLLPVIYCLDLSAFLFSIPLSPACSTVYKQKCYLGVKSYKEPHFIIFIAFTFGSYIFAQNNIPPKTIFITFNIRILAA